MIRKKLSVINAQFITTFASADKVLEVEKPKILVLGRSNVGKSSLLNAIFARKNLVKTSQKPGSTITIQIFNAIFKNNTDDQSLQRSINFVDIPGFGYAKRDKTTISKASDLIEDTLAQCSQFSLILFLMDIRRKPSSDDIRLFKSINQHTDNKCLCVITKSDKESKHKFKSTIQLFAKYLQCDLNQIILTSSSDGTGIDLLNSVVYNSAI